MLYGEEQKTRKEIVESLNRAFHPENYIPVLSELKATCSQQYDFDGKFNTLIKPLLEEELLMEEIEEYLLTEKGEKHLKLHK